jgi:hypothetical protein
VAAKRRRPGRALLGRIGLGLLGLAILIQVLPIGEPRTNPPVLRDAPWPDAEARNLAVGACYACHSNETKWPLYSYVAPFKWLATSDVKRGREALNFSEWGQGEQEDEGADAVEDGSMPPLQYRLVHPEARLSPAERQTLIDALDALEGGGGDRSGRGGGDNGTGDDTSGGGDARGPGRGRGVGGG